MRPFTVIRPPSCLRSSYKIALLINVGNLLKIRVTIFFLDIAAIISSGFTIVIEYKQAFPGQLELLWRQSFFWSEKSKVFGADRSGYFGAQNTDLNGAYVFPVYRSYMRTFITKEYCYNIYSIVYSVFFKKVAFQCLFPNSDQVVAYWYMFISLILSCIIFY